MTAMSKDLRGATPKADNVQKQVEKRKACTAGIIKLYLALLEDIKLVSQVVEHFQHSRQMLLLIHCFLMHNESQSMTALLAGFTSMTKPTISQRILVSMLMGPSALLSHAVKASNVLNGDRRLSMRYGARRNELRVCSRALYVGIRFGCLGYPLQRLSLQT